MSERAGAGLALLLGLCACPPDPAPAAAGQRTLYLGTQPVGTIREENAGPQLQRTSRLTGHAADEPAVTRLSLDPRGFVQSARYMRSSARGHRSVLLEHRTLTDRLSGVQVSLAAPDRPVVLLDVLHHVARPAAPIDVLVVDLASGEQLLGRLLPRAGGGVALVSDTGVPIAHVTAPTEHAAGVRQGPGAFVEGAAGATPAVLHPDAPAVRDHHRLCLTGIDPRGLALDGAGQRDLGGGCVELDRDHHPPAEAWGPVTELFIEHGDPTVQRFAATLTRDRPAATAVAMAEAIHRLLDTSQGGGPPSAREAIARRTGDCDDATAWLVAGLRAAGLTARPVVGYRAHEGHYVPHAWAEVALDGAWYAVDAMVPGLGAFSTHLRLFEGLGGPLTMGRVLGRLRVTPAGPEGDRR